MRGIFTKQWLSIDAGQAVSGIAGRAQTLHIQRGRVWVTVEGVSHDYWLSAGDSLAMIPGCLVVVEADGDGSLVDVLTMRRPAILAQLSERARLLTQRVSFGKAAKAGLEQCALAQCQRQH